MPCVLLLVLAVCATASVAEITVADHAVELANTEDAIPDDTADVVLGQSDMRYPFASRTDARGLVQPSSVAVDTSVRPYRLYVIDSGNHRILGYRTPFAGARPVAADLVLGQPDLHSGFFTEEEAGPERLFTPASVAVDSRGNVYVADADYNRILLFDRPFDTDRIADRAFGQQDNFDSFEPNNGGISAGSLAAPHAICIDPRTNDLWVADTGNNRVLCYRNPIETDRIADIVLGQPDFTSAAANAGGLGAGSFQAPMGVAILGNHLVVADSGNHRILIFDNPPENNGAASRVLGQDGSFTNAERGCSPFRFQFPTGLAPAAFTAGASAGGLLVADTGNSRLLLFDLTDAKRTQPVGLWGQGTNLHSATPNAGGLGPSSLAHPSSMAISPDGVLWVADQDNNRVLAFQDGVRGDRNADQVIGQIDLRHGTENLVDALCVASPRDVAIDRSTQPNRLYVCDAYNNRVLGYGSTHDLNSETPCTIVIGQPDVWSNDAGCGPASLSMPTAVAVDANGGLFVVDRENNRVLWFDAPFEKDAIADRVFGQPDFKSSEANRGGISARTLNRPEGVAVDGDGNLYVADTRNHRILRYDRAIQTDGAADAVWGQQGDFTRGEEYGGIGVRADTFSYPFGLDIRADGWLAATDTNNHRVLLFDTRAADPNKAVRVFGQKNDFSSDRDNLGGCTARSLSGPEAVTFWQAGLFVADTANCRLLWYADLGSTDDAASAVYGQFGSFTRNQRGMGITGARNLWFPTGMDFDSNGSLYVADREQSRILVFRARKLRTRDRGAGGGLTKRAATPNGGPN
ncbi:MAG: NHL repeat-containing protein [Phycisphaerae bacterium]|nr:NHL repeat-containing protein [Phycisphaerae bacterium]